jgi:transposase-like protein/IS1 family transposase
MDPATTFCPNLECPARGQAGQGNIRIHSRKEQRFLCTACHKTFTATQGTVFYRLRLSSETVTRVVTLLAHGCPLQAIVVAFDLDERTVATWWARAGRQGQAVQEHLVEQPRDLGQVQADEIRVKKQGAIVWMALAMMVKTRLWLAGEVSAHRDMTLIRRLIERVRRCAAHRALLFCTDGLSSYIRAIRETFRDPVQAGKGGRPRLRPWRNVLLAQVVKRYERRRVVEVERRIVDGTPARVETLRRRSHGNGVINTAYIERLNATFRERLAPLARRCRALARQMMTLEHGMYVIGAVYNFCSLHASLENTHEAQTPAMAAGITDHCWTIHELLSFHVPPPRWTPPKQRGRPSHALKRLVERWCS